MGIAPTVDYSVDSDEEHTELSVAPVVGWHANIAALQLDDVNHEEQPPVKPATATLGQHDEAAISQVKEPEEGEPREPLTDTASSVGSTHAFS